MSFGSILNRIVNKINASQIEGTLAQDQIPNLDTSKITSGVLPVERGGTGVNSLDSLKQELGSSISSTVFSLEMGQGQRTIVPSGTSIKPFFGIIVEAEQQNFTDLSNLALMCGNTQYNIANNTLGNKDTGKFVCLLPVQKWHWYNSNTIRTAVIENFSIQLTNYQNGVWETAANIDFYGAGEGSTYFPCSCTLTFLHWGN